MPRNDRLIGFLDREAGALRERIAHLKERQAQLPSGVTTGDGDERPDAREARELEQKLAEIEGYLGELRSEAG